MARQRTPVPSTAAPPRRAPPMALPAPVMGKPAGRTPAQQLRQRLGNQATQALVARVAPASRPGAARTPAGAPPAAAAAAAEKDETGAKAAPSAREALAPVVHALHQRASKARHVTPAPQAVGSAQAAAIRPAVEQRRGAAAQTVVDLDGAKADEVRRGEFKARLKLAIEAATPQPKTESEADKVMKTGATQASTAMRSQLGSEREASAGPLKNAAAHEASPDSQPAPRQSELKTDQIGAPPAPVPATPVAPAPLPPERLDYSSDRAPTEQLMAQNQVSRQQLEKGNDPAFGPALESRRSAEQHEAGAETRYRQSEAKVQDNTRVLAQHAIGANLAAMFGARALGVGRVAGRQLGTMSKDAAERQRITDTVNGIKDQTRGAVEDILAGMENEAGELFEAGLARAEQAYEATFEDAKGGVGTWLTTWGSDWEELIEHSLVKARAEYLRLVDVAIDQVADAVDARLKAAKKRVADGLKQIETFIKGLDAGVQKYGQEALEAVTEDFHAMSSEIDQRRDSLVDKLARQYKASSERMSAMEEKLREANKSLWQRAYDATVGLVKKILAFKDMLLSILAKAAGVIGDILSDPIGFLGNLVSAVMQGLKNFTANIGAHLKRGLMGWLFGALGGGGLKLPDTFDLQGIVGIVLQVLGLTYANFRARAVAIVGEPVVAGLEKAADVFKVAITEGIPGLWRFIKDKVADLKAMVLDAIFDFVKERVIVAGVTWIIGLLNPASAFFKACKAIYDIVMFFINRGAQVIELVNAVIESVGAIARGSLGAAAQWIENALAKAIPVAIGFLAGLLGLGDISGTVRKTIDKAQSPVNKAMDWVIGQAFKVAKAAGSLAGGLLGKKGEVKATSHEDDPQKAAKINAGLAAIDREEQKRLKEGHITLGDARAVAAAVKKEHPVFKTLAVHDGGDHWKYRYTASASEEHDSPNKKGDIELEIRQVKLRKNPAYRGSWSEFERDTKQVAREQVLPAELGVPVEFSPLGKTKDQKRPKLVEVPVSPETMAQAMPKAGQAAQAFHLSRLPQEGKNVKGPQIGSSKPDLLVLTADTIVPVEVTVRSSWTLENVESSEAGPRMHKMSQSAALMQNLQPFLKAHPEVKVELIFISNREPDKRAITALETLANETYPGQIRSIKWLYF